MFKIGDRVKALPSITQQDGCDSQFLINKIGIIQFESQDDRGVNWYAVSFDFDDDRLHGCTGFTPHSDGWWCDGDYLSLVPESDVWQ